MGAIFRWGLMFLGIFILFKSVVGWITYDRVDETPQMVSVAEATSMVADDDVHFVSMNATLDTDRRLFKTGLSAPTYSVHPTNSEFVLGESGSPELYELDEYLGCLVTVPGYIDPDGTGVMEVRRVEEGQSESEAEITREKYIGPIMGTDQQILALSPAFFNPSDAEPWYTQSSFRGRLSRLGDIESNASGVTEDVSSIIMHLSNWGVYATNDTLVLLTEHDDPIDYTKHLVPIVGSNAMLFVEVDDQLEHSMTASGTITGLLKSRRPSENSGIGDALNVSLPTRIAMITDESGAEYNTGMASLYQFGIMCGLFMFGFGFGTTWLLHKIKTRNKQKMAQAMNSVLDAMDEDQWKQAA